MNLKNALYYVTHWESWEWRIKYIPLIPVWLWHCMRTGSWWFFTASNPTITFGGFEGESKREIYNQLPPGSFPKSIYISPSCSFSELEHLISTHNFRYPFVVKPDVGKMGFLFRIINNSEQLHDYHIKLPVDYIVQDLIDYPIEVSLFYYRFPNEQSGTITGFLKKEFLEVTGDGKKTLWQLILDYSRVRFMLDEMASKHHDRLEEIIPEGEAYCLSYALNLSRGGKLVSLAHEKDDRLLKVFNDLSDYSKYFYYGRYDIKCSSIEDLKEGRNFSILEYNGSGAEAHHVYGNGYTLLQAYSILLHHWNVLYKISKYNRKNGIHYWDLRRGLIFVKKVRKHIKIISRLDKEVP
ncbi:MAG: hypothetical protein H0W62_07005 [Chitinophagales bacterium]|nr:hypothetical protein [Chitinophagales bacterium]